MGVMDSSDSQPQPRAYYSVRTGKNPLVRFDLAAFRRMLRSVFDAFDEKCYFQEQFGYVCVDAGRINGKLGSDIPAAVLMRLRKTDLWPIADNIDHYLEEDVFDMVEFLYDHVSKPREGTYHGWDECGWHYETFDAEAGREEFRAEMNLILRDYAEGYELSDTGEILALASEPGLQPLLDAAVPAYDPKNVQRRVEAAILKFRRHRATAENRRDAVRDLADVLEYLRPELEKVLTKKDESMLFQLANQFAIRHHNDQQMADYDYAIWHSWMFYVNLATVQAAIRALARS